MAEHIDVTHSVHSSLKTDDFDKVYQYCKDNGVLFMDKQFPNGPASLYENPPHPEYKGQWAKYGWSRASKILGQGKYNIFTDEISPSDIRQGQLGDCYFLCSLASMAEQPSLIKRLFYLKEVNQHGVLGVWLHINGQWTLYILDEYFPTGTATGKLDFAFSKSVNNEIWVPVLEKAYAKAYSSYFDITGGDPVHALRDLTGAPYDRIEDYSKLPEAWAKLKEANAQNFILTCFTKSAETVEQQSGDGLVSGHAYSILDVREVVDSRGKVRMILQIRNPWGKFEWKGDFSDDSPLWTPEAKRQLQVVSSDDGVFWMPFEKFVESYEGIGIVKVKPGYVNNSIVVKRVNPIDKSIVRLTISEAKNNVTVSIDQMDSKWIDNKNYSLSYFRVTIGKIVGKDKIEFVNSVLSPERNVFLEDSYSKGDYVILVEAYWSNTLPESYTVGTYSENHVELELLSADSGLYQATERLIWHSFAEKWKERLKGLRSRTVNQGSNSANIDLYNFQDQNYGLNLYATFNNSNSFAVHQTYKIIESKGYDVVALSGSGNKFEVVANPKDVDIILFKMNPLSDGFKLSHQVISEELIAKEFQKDLKTIELLVQLGAVRPTAKDTDPVIKARELAQKEAEENKKKNQAAEAARKKAQEDQQAAIRDNVKDSQQFWKDQKSLLEEFAKNNNLDAQKYLDKNNNVDPFFVMSESFKNIKINDGNGYSNTNQGQSGQKYQQFTYYGGGGQNYLPSTNWYNSYNTGWSSNLTNWGQAATPQPLYRQQPSEQQYGYTLYGTQQKTDSGCELF